jgi:hypothetical protein
VLCEQCIPLGQLALSHEPSRQKLALHVTATVPELGCGHVALDAHGCAQ